jgi:hypothetical protein
MPDKGWLKEILEEARKDVNSRPDWQRKRVLAADQRGERPVDEPQSLEEPPKQNPLSECA